MMQMLRSQQAVASYVAGTIFDMGRRAEDFDTVRAQQELFGWSPSVSHYFPHYVHNTMCRVLLERYQL